MKNIQQIHRERIGATEKDARSDSFESSAFLAHVRFWHRIERTVHPRRLAPGARVTAFYERTGRVPASLMETCHKRMKELLKVPRLTMSSWFRLNPLFCDLMEKAMTNDNADLACCALAEFAQYELGGAVDPEYRSHAASSPSNRPFNDDDWDDDWAEFMAKYGDSDDGYSGSECRTLIWFRQWEELIESPLRFEKEFPGMGHRRENLALAMRPIFRHLDPVVDAHVLELCLAWIRPLMKSDFEENRLPSKPTVPNREVSAEAA